MKVSFNWLNQYIDIQDYRSRLGELENLLTQAGLEVEEMVNPSEHWGHVVVGELVQVGSHPDADKLTLCQVNVGASEPLQIVCGAKNHKQGDFVAVAQVGAVLPGDFKIKQSKIRGMQSSGMLCSELELGLSAESEGILILSPEHKPGTPLPDLQELSDIVFELNVTPNRADCLSHLGLARELSTLLDRAVQLPSVKLPAVKGDLSEVIHVQLNDSQACPRYCGRMIKGVQVAASPDWLKRRIEAVGLNAINNIVDVTNFVLFEFGQPLHAFDLKKISKSQLCIEKAAKGEKFTTLDSSEISLSESDLVIRDGARPVALAGVVGGLNSGVSEETQDIFLESAFFVAEGVRRTSRSHGIETDSCYRFSRGVDPAQTLLALDRAAALIQEVAGGEVQAGVVDIYPKPYVTQPISIATSYVEERLGLAVSAKSFENWMQRLGCCVQESKGLFQVTPPTFRWDLRIKEDLVEEYARLNGYDQLIETLPELHHEPGHHRPLYQMTEKIQNSLAGMGLHQAVNYAFIGRGESQKIWTSATVAANWGLTMSDEPVQLLNPLSEDLAVMRESLLPSLFKNLVFNHHRGNTLGRVFELAPSHNKSSEGFQEENRLALAFWGHNQGLWAQKKEHATVFELKSTIEALMIKLGSTRFRWDKVRAEDCPQGFHPTQTAALFYEGSYVGLLGSLHPRLKDKNKIRVDVAWTELNFDKLCVRQPRSAKFKPLPKFPGVERDVAFVAPESMSVQQILTEIKKSAGALLVDCQVFDLYQDETLKSHGQRSIAFRLRFQSDKQTLTDDEINGLRDKVVNSVCQKQGLEIR